MPLAWPLLAFSHFLHYPQANWVGHCGADSQVSGFVYILGCCGSLQRPLLWVWEFLLLRQPPQVFQSKVLKLYFPDLEPWVVQSVLLHSCSGCKCGAAHSANRHVTRSASCRLALSPLCPSCPSLPLLPVWMNVSSLTPWLLDFHTVLFSVSSGWFLFLNCCLLLLVVEGGTMYLSTPQSWPGENNILLDKWGCLYLVFKSILILFRVPLNTWNGSITSFSEI